MGRRAATLLIASVVGFAAPITLYAAGSRYFVPGGAEAIPAHEILTRLRSLALDPIGQPLRRGPYYIMHAYDRRGAEMRVVADAHFGDVISVTPATLVSLPGPGTVGGARIIHVPAPGEEEASVAPDGEPDLEQAVPEEPVQPVRPKAKHHPQPAAKQVSREPETRRRPFSSEPPPPAPAERRAILTAPPPPPAPLDDGPTPIRPTPRFGAAGQATVVIPPPPPPPAPPAASEPAPADSPTAQD